MIENIKGFAHVGLFVSNMSVSQKFYSDIFGFEVIFERTEPFPEGGAVQIAFLKMKDFAFEMICVPGLNFPSDGKFQHLAFEVKDIEDAKEKLEANGIMTEELVYSPETFANGAKWVNFKGPDGENLEITEVL